MECKPLNFAQKVMIELALALGAFLSLPSSLLSSSLCSGASKFQPNKLQSSGSPQVYLRAIEEEGQLASCFYISVESWWQEQCCRNGFQPGVDN